MSDWLSPVTHQKCLESRYLTFSACTVELYLPPTKYHRAKIPKRRGKVYMLNSSKTDPCALLVPFFLTLVREKNNFSFLPASLGIHLACWDTLLKGSPAESMVLTQRPCPWRSLSEFCPRIELHWLRCLGLQSSLLPNSHSHNRYSPDPRIGPIDNENPSIPVIDNRLREVSIIIIQCGILFLK